MPLKRDARRRLHNELHEIAADDAVEPTTARLERLRWSAQRRIHTVHICLENLCNPGNRAAITRSMDAFGMIHLHEVESGVDLAGDNPVGRGDQTLLNGGEKWLTVHRHKSVDGFVRRLTTLAGDSSVEILCAMPPPVDAPPNTHDQRAAKLGASVQHVPKATPHTSLNELSFSRRHSETEKRLVTVLVFGNERNGVSPAMLRASTGTFDISQFGLVESLNVSVSVAITCAHVRRVLGVDGDGSVEATRELVNDYETRGRMANWKKNRIASNASYTGTDGKSAQRKLDKESRRELWLKRSEFGHTNQSSGLRLETELVPQDGVWREVVLSTKVIGILGAIGIAFLLGMKVGELRRR
eukprot:TRINITY_DN39236_c0_g1_i1.p1 TRINITY_DN39236_c0_g1~~TRINITY_DN39236_c0_g1_i1.p1  ORF type:complete len:356 (-),score=35.26 TRINITY_DN39236_c0_g1_i1:144-1211(-)